MLGGRAAESDAADGGQAEQRPPAVAATTPRLAARDLAVGGGCTMSPSSSAPARSSASPRSRARARTSCSRSWLGRGDPTGASSWSTARPAFRHPADAIRAGLVYVPADRVEALLMQRSVRENIALPYIAGFRSWGPIRMAAERRRSTRRSPELQIDTRAASEVRQLSGGNQQKVTIARWVAGGSRRCCASTRPAASTSGPSSRSTTWSASSRRPAPRCCSTPPNSRRSSWPATGRSSSSAGGRRRYPGRGRRRADPAPSGLRPAQGRSDARGGRRRRGRARSAARIRRRVSRPGDRPTLGPQVSA